MFIVISMFCIIVFILFIFLHIKRFAIHFYSAGSVLTSSTLSTRAPALWQHLYAIHFYSFFLYSFLQIIYIYIRKYIDMHINMYMLVVIYILVIVVVATCYIYLRFRSVYYCIYRRPQWSSPSECSLHLEVQHRKSSLAWNSNKPRSKQELPQSYDPDGSDSGSVPKQFDLTYPSGISLFSFSCVKTGIPYELWASAGSPVDVRLPDKPSLAEATGRSLGKPGTRAATTNATHPTPTRHDTCGTKGKFMKTYNKHQQAKGETIYLWKCLEAPWLVHVKLKEFGMMAHISSYF